MFALEMKEDLKIAIEEQQEMGLDGLEEGINLDYLETTSGKDEALTGLFSSKQPELPS